MTSSASDLLKLEKQGTGDNASTWGTTANTVFSRIEEAIADITNIAVTGANYTLDDTQYAEHVDGSNSSESHVAMIKITGALTGNRQVIVPLRNKQYTVWNATTESYTITIISSSGNGIVVPQGYIMEVFCDGSNVEARSHPVDAAGILAPLLGDINMNGNDIDDTNGNQLLIFTETSSAVNELTVKNEATGSNPGATASGGDTNIGIDFIPKGTGKLEQAGVAVGLVGKHALPIPATGMYATTTAGASLGTAETSTYKVMVKTWDFDASTRENIQFQVPLPESYDGGVFTAVFLWSHPATTTNFGVTWGIEATAFDNDQALDSDWGVDVDTDDTGGTTDDLYVSAASGNITLSGADTSAEFAIFQIFRDVSDAADNMAVDARLHGIRLYLTTDAGNDA